MAKELEDLKGKKVKVKFLDGEIKECKVLGVGSYKSTIVLNTEKGAVLLRHVKWIEEVAQNEDVRS